MYDGIKRGYPRIPDKISAYIQLCRPFTVAAPIVVAFLVMGIEELYHGRTVLSSPLFFKAVLAGVSMGLLQLTGQVSNQLCDGAEYDRECGKGYRPIPQGKVTESGAWSIVFISVIFSLLIGFYIRYIYGLFMCLLLFFAVFNNLEPIRAKKRYIVNEVWLGVSRGFLPPIAFWFVLDGFDMIAVWIAAVAFLYVFATNWTKDITDYEADKKFGAKTFLVATGGDVKKVSNEMIKPVIFILVIITYMVINYGLVFVSLSVFAIFALYILYNTRRGDIKKMESMENTLVWILFYIGLMAGYLALFLVLRLDEFISCLFA